MQLGFSTCPNDTFIFYALLHNKTDFKAKDIEVKLTDVEELNKMALAGEGDVLKVSFATYLKITDKYVLLNSGAALGSGVGPLLISKAKIYPDELADVKIGIPGENTTANMLLNFAFPEAINKSTYLFSDIETALLDGEIDAGLIIHENRFTYEKKGLHKIIDLGDFWERETGAPIPLGGIVIKKSLPNMQKKSFDRALQESVKWAFDNPQATHSYVKQYAQEMEDNIILKHINTYVNQFSLSFGDEGKKAVELLFQKAKEVGKIHDIPTQLFL